MPGIPQKQKGIITTIIKQIQKLAKINKPIINKNLFFSHLFPLRSEPPN
jgi:hypothetical protein